MKIPTPALIYSENGFCAVGLDLLESLISEQPMILGDFEN